MKTKINFKEFVLFILIIYSVFSIIRSLGLLFLAFTDKYFYNFDFGLEYLPTKIRVFDNVTHWFTYGVGIVVSFFILKLMKIKIYPSLVYLLISLSTFVLCDLRYIRSIFLFAENPRYNLLINILFFGILFLVSYKLYYKLKKKGY